MSISNFPQLKNSPFTFAVLSLNALEKNKKRSSWHLQSNNKLLTFSQQILSTFLNVRHPLRLLRCSRCINGERFAGTDYLPSIPQVYSIKRPSVTFQTLLWQPVYFQQYFMHCRWFCVQVTSYSPHDNWLGSVLGQHVVLVNERSRVRLPPLHCRVAQVNLVFHPSEVGKSSTGLLAGVKEGHVHLFRVAGNTV